MARRREKHVVDILFDMAATLPWWAGAIIAVVSYFVCRSFAIAEVPAAKDISQFAPTIEQTIIKALATFGQYVLPMIFIAGAVASAIAQVKRGKTAAGKVESFSSFPSSQPGQAKTGSTNVLPDQHESKIYPTRHSDLTEGVPTVAIDTTQWSAALLSALEWKRFEMVCAGLFERLGFDIRTATKGADGGVDIHLFRPPEDQAVAIVQCKAWAVSSKVGVRLIRELHGVMASKHITDGILATTTTFSDDAKEYAKANHIDLMDGSAVLKSIGTLTEERQASLLQLATAGDYTTPTCPSCGVKMTKRTAKVDGKPFWGCVNYPRCRSIINIAKT